MPEQKYAPVDGTNCEYCHKSRLEFVSLASDEELAEYDCWQQIEILMKGHHIGNFVCKTCGEKSQAWVQYRKPYPEYSED